MSVEATRLPHGSRLSVFRRQKDFLDCYKSENVSEKHSIREAATIALADGPDWVRKLMQLRNKLVAPFGLKSGDIQSLERVPAQQSGVDDRLGIFRVYSQTDNELIMGEDDKHLDFRISVYRESKSLYLATWVHPHNIWGWGYLSLVLPFHKAIVRDSLMRLEEA
ncbi:MAG: DUF2867 domain-containing protein [Kordiimonas sp.]